MITLNTTAGAENKIIYFIKLTLISSSNVTTVIKLATEQKNLAGTIWYGNVITLESMELLSKEIDISLGGAIRGVGNWQFSIPRDNSNIYLSSFQNSLKPNSSGYYILSQRIEIGIGWDTTTTESGITWLESHYIETQNVDFFNLTFSTVEESELDDAIIPPYLAQKTDSSKLYSYYPKLPDANVGRVIPIIFGDYGEDYLTVLEMGVGEKHPARVPVIVIDSANVQVLYSCHKMNSVFAGYKYLSRYLQSVDTMFLFRNNTDTEATVTNYQGATILTLRTGTDRLTGVLVVQMTEKGDYGDFGDISNATDNSIDSYVTLEYPLANDRALTLRLKGSLSNEDCGTLGETRVCFVLQSNDGGYKDCMLGYYLPGSSSVTSTTTSILSKDTYYKIFGDGATTQASDLSNVTYIVRNDCFNNGAQSLDSVKAFTGFIYAPDVDVSGLTWTTKRARSNSLVYNQYWDKIDSSFRRKYGL